MKEILALFIIVGIFSMLYVMPVLVCTSYIKTQVGMNYSKLPAYFPVINIFYLGSITGDGFAKAASFGSVLAPFFGIVQRAVLFFLKVEDMKIHVISALILIVLLAIGYICDSILMVRLIQQIGSRTAFMIITAALVPLIAKVFFQHSWYEILLLENKTELEVSEIERRRARRTTTNTSINRTRELGN